MAQTDLSSRELAIVLAALEYWADNHEDNNPDDQMDEELEQATFGDAGQPLYGEIAQLLKKLGSFDSDVQPDWRSSR